MSTSTSYLMLTRDLTRTMSNLARDRTVAGAAQYYQANIGKVKSVDDLMSDYKLYTYAMKAYGLEDMAYARSFMRKVLTSDMNDTDSFANKLTDKRYQEMALAFNFGTDGKVTAVTDVQSDLQEKEVTGLYAQTIIGKQQTVESDVISYSTSIDAVTTVDGFLNNSKLFSFAMTAFGLGDRVQYASKSFYRDLLTKDLADPANPIGTITESALKAKLTSFASAFSFQADGTVASGSTAQTAAAKGQTIDGYLAATGQASTGFNTLRTVDAYRAGIAAIDNVDDLIADTKLYSFALVAYGIDPASTTTADVRAALLSDPDDPAGAASTMGLGFQRLARAFEFAADGSLPSGTPAQSAASVSDTVTRYLGHVNASKQGDLTEYTTFRLATADPAIIGTVDKMLDNANAYNFVLRSFGFDPLTASRANIRAALVSDLDDPQSFANQNSNANYRLMASMFNFAADGSIETGEPLISDANAKDLQLRYKAKGYGAITATTQATSAYQVDMRSVTNVDGFLSDKASFSFALVAFGFDKDLASKPFFRQVLTSDLNDPQSFANQQTDTRYRDFAAAFNFATDGSLPSGTPAQSKVAQDAMIERFLGNTSSSSAAYRLKVANDYATGISAVRTVSSFLSADNDALYQIALKAYGVDPTTTSKTEIESILTSDLANPSSAANKKSGAFLELARAFNFGTGGIVPNGVDTQTAAQIEKTVNGYLASTVDARNATITAATSTFKSGMNLLETLSKAAGVKPIDEFLRNTALYDYAMKAYGLDPAQESRFDVRRALLSNPADPFSFVNQPAGAKFKALAAAMNFDADGTVGTPRMAQELESAKRLAVKYNASFPAAANTAAAATQKAAITAETDYYATAILKVSTVDDLVADKRVTDYIRKAFGFTASDLPASTLKSILTSDLADAKSFTNTAKDVRYREIAGLFNFDTKGASKRVAEQAAQDGAGIANTYENYLRQKLETDAGETDAGVRLALYFQRKASTLTSAYAVMADKALYEVVRTALQIPDEAIRADIEVLARTIEKRITFSDFQDPKKVDKFIKQFTALYDAKNGGGTGTPNSIALSLISGDVDTGFSTSLLTGMQRIRASRF